MKNTKFMTIVLMMALIAVSLGGCTEDPQPPAKTPVNVGALRGPSGMGLAALMAWSEEGSTDNDYNFTLGGAPEEMTAGIISGEFDIALVPTNIASVLYNVTGGEVRLIALKTKGVLFVLDSTGEINAIEDLRGKTINVSGQGAIPQFAFEHVLRGNGLEPGVDVEIVFNAEHSELAALMVAGEVSIGLLPQPFVTTVTNQNEDVRIALDLTAEWEAVNPGTAMVQTAVVVRTEFLEQNPDAVEVFIRESKESTDFVNANPEEASQYIGNFDIVPQPVAVRAIPKSNLVSISGLEMRPLAEAFLEVLLEANPPSIGGAIPDEDFFFFGQ